MSGRETFALIILIASAALGLGWFIIAAISMLRQTPRGLDMETAWAPTLIKLYGSFLLVTLLVILLLFSSYALYV